MTVSPHGMPGGQHGQPPGPAAPALPAAPAPPPGYDWRNQGPPPARRNKGLMVAVAAAILAIGALVVGVIDLARPAPTSSRSAPAPTSPTPAPPQNTTEADRALCQAISPLMADIDRISNTYMGLGPGGSPQRDSALPKFISDIQDWGKRIQPVLDSHPNVDPYFERSLQRFIDDRKLLAADLEPGPTKAYDEAIWSDSMAAMGGPLSTCYDVGVQW